MNGLGVHATRGHQDHPRVPCALQCRCEHFGEQQRAEDVRRDTELVSLPTLGAGGGHDSRVVDEYVHLVGPADEIDGEIPHVRQVGDIASPHLDEGAGNSLGDLRGRGDPTRGIAHHQDDRGAEFGQAEGDRLADAGVRTGDHGGPAPQCLRRERRPPSASHLEADPAVAGSDGAVECGVDEARKVSGHRAPLPDRSTDNLCIVCASFQW